MGVRRTGPPGANRPGRGQYCLAYDFAAPFDARKTLGSDKRWRAHIGSPSVYAEFAGPPISFPDQLQSRTSNPMVQGHGSQTHRLLVLTLCRTPTVCPTVCPTAPRICARANECDKTEQENNWGGGDSERKASILEEELMNLFRTKKEIYKDEVHILLYFCHCGTCVIPTVTYSIGISTNSDGSSVRTVISCQVLQPIVIIQSARCFSQHDCLH